MSFAATEARFYAKLANKYLKMRASAMDAARAAKVVGDVEVMTRMVRAARGNNRQALAMRAQRAVYRAKMLENGR